MPLPGFRPILLLPVAGALLLRAQSGPVRLIAGQPITATLAAGSHRCYTAKLPARTFARFFAAQISGDLALELRAPGAAAPVRADSFEFGVEEFGLITSAAGTYLVCASSGGSAGQPIRYRLSLDAPRPPQPEDEMRIEAVRLSAESKRLAAAASRPELSRSIEVNRQALSLWEKLGDTDSQVRTLVKLGDSHNALSEYDAAKQAYADALAKDPTREDRAAAEAIANGALASLWMGDPESARAGFEESLRIFERLGIPSSMAAIRNNLGLLCLRTSEFQEALDYFLAAMPVLRRMGPRPEGLVLSNIAVAYRSLGEYRRAEDYLERSAGLLSAPADRTAKGKALVNLARIHTLDGDWPGAKRVFEEATPLLADSPDAGARGDLDNNLGQLLYDTGDFRASLDRLDRAYEIYRTIHHAQGISSSSHFAGLDLAALGKPAAALVRLEEALRLRLSASMLDDAASTLVEIARLQRGLGRTDEARASLKQAIQIGDELRVRMAAPDLRASYFVSKRPAFEEMIDLLVELHDRGGPPSLIAEALETEERARSRSLLDALAGSRYRLLRSIDPALAAQERQIVRALSFKSQQLSQLPAKPESEPRRAALTREAEELESSYFSLDGAMARDDPRRADLTAIPALDAEAIGRELDADTVLLEFSLGSKRSFLWVVSSGAIACYPLPAREEIEALARPVASLTGARATRLAKPELGRQLSAVSAELSRTLFAAAAPLLRGKRLLIAADGILNSVPFAALPAPDDPRVPMGVLHELAAVPSASALRALRNHAPTAPRGGLQIVLFADPVFSGNVASLPYSLREAQWIREAAQGAHVSLHTGFAATKSAFAAPETGSAGILHIATHARLDESRPELSGIYFSQRDSRGNARDGFLSLNEIYDLNLPIDLVVLSACGTARGKAAGDGVAGLARAFFFAGVSRVLASLWNVSDEGTARFMRSFYENLTANGLAPSAALRAAREAMYNDRRWRDPSYWAAFVLVGDWRPLVQAISLQP